MSAFVLKVYDYWQVVAESAMIDRPQPCAPRFLAAILLVGLKQEVMADNLHGVMCEVQMAVCIGKACADDTLVEHLPVAAVAVGAARRVWVGAQIGYVVELGVRGRRAKGRGVVSEGLCPEMAAQYAAVRGIVHVADNDDVCTWIGCEQAVGVRT